MATGQKEKCGRQGYFKLKTDLRVKGVGVQKMKEFEMIPSAKTRSTLALERATIKDKSVDTFKQNKHFLSASFRNFKKDLFCR